MILFWKDIKKGKTLLFLVYIDLWSFMIDHYDSITLMPNMYILRVNSNPHFVLHRSISFSFIYVASSFFLFNCHLCAALITVA